MLLEQGKYVDWKLSWLYEGHNNGSHVNWEDLSLCIAILLEIRYLNVYMDKWNDHRDVYAAIWFIKLVYQIAIVL